MPIAYMELTVDTGCTTMLASDLKKRGGRPISVLNYQGLSL